MQSTGVPLTRIIKNLELEDISRPVLINLINLHKQMEEIKEEHVTALMYLVPLPLQKPGMLDDVYLMSTEEVEGHVEGDPVASAYTVKRLKDFSLTLHILGAYSLKVKDLNLGLYLPVNSAKENASDNRFEKVKGKQFHGCFPVGEWK